MQIFKYMRTLYQKTMFSKCESKVIKKKNHVLTTLITTIPNELKLILNYVYFKFYHET